MNRGLIIVFIFALLFLGTSCSTTRRTSTSDQRRGLLMLEGERVYKNKGFYKEKSKAKRRKKNIKRTQKRPRR